MTPAPRSSSSASAIPGSPSRDAMRGEAAWIGGTVRSADKAARASGRGHRRLSSSTGSGRATASPRRSARRRTSSSPSRRARAATRCSPSHGDDILAAPHLAWIGYLSTVGVYGDHGGAWIDEETPPDPRVARDRGADRGGEGVDGPRPARAACRSASSASPASTGRGGTRSSSSPRARAHRIVKPGQVFNRIHVADIAATLRAAIARPAARLYNVADDEPAPPQDVVAYAAGLMGIAPPPEVPFAEADLSPMARSFYEGNRRIANRRIRDELGVSLAYPTYRDGLSALWRDGTWRG